MFIETYITRLTSFVKLTLVDGKHFSSNTLDMNLAMFETNYSFADCVAFVPDLKSELIFVSES